MHVDALIVVNQDVQLSGLRSVMRGSGRFVVLSSHQYYPDELAEFSGVEVVWKTFADLLSDEEEFAIDGRVISELMDAGCPKRELGDMYTKGVLREKNRLLVEKVRKAYVPAAVYAADGLGIDFEVWKVEFDAAGIPIVDSPRRHRSLGSRIGRQWGKLKRWISSPVLFDGTDYYWFPKGLKRIGDFKDVEVVPAHFLHRRHDGSGCGWRIVGGRVSRIRPYLCCGLHNYVPRCDYMFQDGYYPSNYSISSYPELEMKYWCVASPFVWGWMESCHQHPTFLPRIQVVRKLPVFSVASVERRRVILVALNHAGDWSALINRSDTDRMVLAMAEIARYHPDVDIVIRTHPIMAMKIHEGVQSRERVRRHVQECALKNLIYSTKSLDGDLARADLIIGEYTNVLTSGYERGIPGLIVNLTGRRSFMKDYENLGFPAVSDLSALDAYFAHIERSLRQSVEQLNAAVVKYNSLVDEMYANGGRCSSLNKVIQ